MMMKWRYLIVASVGSAVFALLVYMRWIPPFSRETVLSGGRTFLAEDAAVGVSRFFFCAAIAFLAIAVAGFLKTRD